MALIRMNSPFDIFDQHVNRLLAHELAPSRRAAGFPRVDVFELGEAYEVAVELPGVGVDDVQLELIDDVLVLSGERRAIQDTDEDSFRRQERWTGPWKREITFPKRVTPEDVSAALANGLLTIRVGKADEVKPKRIPIDVG